MFLIEFVILINNLTWKTITKTKTIKGKSRTRSVEIRQKAILEAKASKRYGRRSVRKRSSKRQMNKKISCVLSVVRDPKTVTTMNYENTRSEMTNSMNIIEGNSRKSSNLKKNLMSLRKYFWINFLLHLE